MNPWADEKYEIAHMTIVPLPRLVLKVAWWDASNFFHECNVEINDKGEMVYRVLSYYPETPIPDIVKARLEDLWSFYRTKMKEWING